MKKLNIDKIALIILIALVGISLLELLFPGILYGHDLRFHMARINALKDSLNIGNIPALIYPYYEYSYGYASGVFYPHLFLYIPAILTYLGMPILTSYKLFVVIETIALVSTMYYSVNKMTKSKFASATSSIIYLMSSYRITDMYLRSAVGETLTFIFFPIFILGLYKIFYDNEDEWPYFTIALIGIVLSHVISGLFCLILTIIFFILNIKKVFNERKRLTNLIIAGVIAILITSAFTFPMLEMMVSDTFSYQNITATNMTLEMASNPLYVVAEVPSGILPWQPPGVGIIFVFLFFYFRKSIKNERFAKTCLILGIIFLILSTKLAPWSILNKVLGMIQFPWRLFILVTLLFIFGFALHIKNLEDTKKKKFVFFIVSISMFTYALLSYYHYRFEFVDEFWPYYISQAEYIPSKVDRTKIKERGEKITTNNNDLVISYLKTGTNLKITYKNNNQKDTYIDLPLIYYKGYVATSQNYKYQVEKQDEGYVRVNLKDMNEDTINVKYGITNIRKISYILSILSTITFIVIIYYKKRK